MGGLRCRCAPERWKGLVPLDLVRTPGDGDGDDPEEVHLIARGIATAVAPETGITDVPADLLEAIAAALAAVTADYRTREPPGLEERPAVPGRREPDNRHRIAHHLVLGEPVLLPS